MSASANRSGAGNGAGRNDLRGIELLSDLGATALRVLERHCRWHSYAANRLILRCGDRAKHDVYFVVQGHVRIVNYSSTGREIVFSNVREGGTFGELGALAGYPQMTSVLTVTDCRLASASPPVFQRLIHDNPGLGLRVLARVADTVTRYEQRIMELSTLSAVQRVHLELVRLAKFDVDRSGHWVVSPIPTHSYIASRASTSRETVVRAITRLADAGNIVRRDNALYIRRPGLPPETAAEDLVVAAQ